MGSILESTVNHNDLWDRSLKSIVKHNDLWTKAAGGLRPRVGQGVGTAWWIWAWSWPETAVKHSESRPGPSVRAKKTLQVNEIHRVNRSRDQGKMEEKLLQVDWSVHW